MNDSTSDTRESEGSGENTATNQSTASASNRRSTQKRPLLWAVFVSIVAILLLAAAMFRLLRQSQVQVAGSDAPPGEARSSAPNPVEDTTAMLEPPPLPPLPDIYISDLKPISFLNGWGQFGLNKSVVGKPLKVGGKTYERGLGTHAYGEVIFEIPAEAGRFVAVVGLDDEVADDKWRRGSVCFQVYGNVNEMYEPLVLLGQSPVLSPKTIRSWALDVGLEPRFKTIELIVSDAEDGNECDHADWVNAGFLRSEGERVAP